MASSHDNKETLVEKNRKFFDDASTHVFTKPWIQDLQSQISKHLCSNLEWLGIIPGDDPLGAGRTPTKMLDYACGNGVPSQTLSPHFTTCIGMDVSEGMLATYTSAATSLNLPPTRMRAVRGDLMTTDVDSALLTEELSDFDLVVISMALHHLQDVGEAVRRLVGRLRRGGMCVVVDWASQGDKDFGKAEKARGELEDDQQAHHQQHQQHHHGQRDGSHPAAHTMAHHSFSTEQMQEAFHNAGCEDFDFVLHEEPSAGVPMAKGEMRLFFAKGKKV